MTPHIEGLGLEHFFDSPVLGPAPTLDQLVDMMRNLKAHKMTDVDGLLVFSSIEAKFKELPPDSYFDIQISEKAFERLSKVDTYRPFLVEKRGQKIDQTVPDDKAYASYHLRIHTPVTDIASIPDEKYTLTWEMQKPDAHDIPCFALVTIDKTSHPETEHTHNYTPLGKLGPTDILHIDIKENAPPNHLMYQKEISEY